MLNINKLYLYCCRYILYGKLKNVLTSIEKEIDEQIIQSNILFSISKWELRISSFYPNILMTSRMKTSLFMFTLLRWRLIVHNPFKRTSPVVDRSHVYTLLNVLNDLSIVHVVGGSDIKTLSIWKIAG